mgnify:FL=1
MKDIQVVSHAELLNEGRATAREPCVMERGMRTFKSRRHAPRFVAVDAVAKPRFNRGRYPDSAQHDCDVRVCAFGEWNRVALDAREPNLIDRVN